MTSCSKRQVVRDPGACLQAVLDTQAVVVSHLALGLGSFPGIPEVADGLSLDVVGCCQLQILQLVIILITLLFLLTCMSHRTSAGQARNSGDSRWKSSPYETSCQRIQSMMISSQGLIGGLWSCTKGAVCSGCASSGAPDLSVVHLVRAILHQKQDSS